MRISSLCFVVMLAIPNIVFGQEKSGEIPITLEELDRRSLVGRLGRPLGTAVEIDATIVAGRDLRQKGTDSQYFLKVSHVDGKRLDDSPLMPFVVPAFASVDLASDTDSLHAMKLGAKARSLSSSQIAELEKDQLELMCGC